MKLETLLSHLAENGGIHDPYASTFFPIYNTATFDISKQAGDTIYDYTRSGSPSLESLANVLAKAENAAGAVCVNTGLGAVDLLFSNCLHSGKKIILEKDLYGGTQRLLKRYQNLYQIELIYMDLTDLDQLEATLRKGSVDLIHCESPTNPGLKILDLRAISRLAKQYGVKLSVDNSLATFASQKPLDLGADFSVSSTTKYISGHGAVTAGLLVAKSMEDFKSIEKAYIAEGRAQSPIDGFLISLGLATLPLRLKQHQASALVVAQYLMDQPCVDSVVYPGLATHPQHTLAKSQMTCFNGVITVHFKDVATAEAFIHRTKLFHEKVSFGSPDSRAEIPAHMSHASCSEETLREVGIFPSSVRISIGLEHVDDLIADIQQAINPCFMSSFSLTSEFKTGDELPKDNPFAISCHFDTIKDVCDYEEGVTEVIQKLKTAYPRFFVHSYEYQLKTKLAEQHQTTPEKIFVFSSEIGTQQAIQTLQIETQVFNYQGIYYLVYDDVSSLLRHFIQHSGTKAFPRQIHAVLNQQPIVDSTPYELTIKQALASLYGVSEQFCQLHNSGMNAVFSIFEAIKEYNTSRKVFVMYGWLYLCSQSILKKYADECIEVVNVTALDELSQLISTRGNELAAVFTEVPTNPHLETPDLEQLHRILADQEIFLVVDTTIGTPVNVDVIPYVDVIVESLSKFAGGHGDLLAGLSLPISEKGKQLFPAIKTATTPFYGSDAAVLAPYMSEYTGRVTQISAAIPELVHFFENHPSIKKVYYTDQSAYKKIQKRPDAYAGLISIEFFDEATFIKVYDALKLPKGPSLGTLFTLVMPYFYLAHYDEILDGRLEQQGINPYLFRISVGVEPVAELIDRFAKALDC